VATAPATGQDVHAERQAESTAVVAAFLEA
jgi:hypothetical protein